MSNFQLYNPPSLLAVKIGANMNTTGDQEMPIPYPKYIVRRMVVANASTSLTLAAGGLYTASSKGGTAVVSSAQVYSALTGSTKFLDVTIAALTDVITVASLYFSLTVAQGGAATADVYIFGDILPHH